MSTPRFTLLITLLAAALFAAVRWMTLSGEHAARLDIAALSTVQPDQPARPVPTADVARALRTLKIVTVDLHTVVESSRLDPSWRGDVSATVSAPARLLYGCDLSRISETPSDGTGLRRNALTGEYTLTVPRPVRIATEVEGDRETHDVSVGWGRFRDLSGEFQLGLARAALHHQARLMRLTPAQQREIETITREQLTTLVRGFALAGDDLSVRVEFTDHEAPGLVGVSDQAPPFSGDGAR
ncbi:MAG: hypothetical protein IT438_07590 [Phycisphaerales bacterium]|nr:hypothetical protein [Phycisphaerales bacterium]